MIDEEKTCTCGAGHGSLEKHMDWCDWIAPDRNTFCGRDDCHLNRESNMMPLPDGGCCDPCIEPIVRALQEAGIGTIASCCGHGFRPGCIILKNRTEIHIARDFAEGRAIDALFPIDINGTDERKL